MPDAPPRSYRLDVRDASAVQACFDAMRRDHGTITHAVANAGIGAATPLFEMTDAQWHAVMDVNLHGEAVP